MFNATQEISANNSVHVNVLVKLRAKDAPLSCPPRNMPVWDLHPKVYLPLNHDNEATCPYCQTHYVLSDE